MVSTGQETWGSLPHVSTASAKPTRPLTPYIANEDNKHSTVPDDKRVSLHLDKLDKLLTLQTWPGSRVSLLLKKLLAWCRGSRSPADLTSEERDYSRKSQSEDQQDANADRAGMHGWAALRKTVKGPDGQYEED